MGFWKTVSDPAPFRRVHHAGAETGAPLADRKGPFAMNNLPLPTSISSCERLSFVLGVLLYETCQDISSIIARTSGRLFMRMPASAKARASAPGCTGCASTRTGTSTAAPVARPCRCR